MSEPRPPRPKALLDAIEAEPAGAFRGPLWRVVTDGYDPLRPSRAGGRWDDGSFDVLYTSTARDGALAESWFHASRGQPIIPSKVRKRLFRLHATLDRVLDLTADGKLAALGVNMATYGRLELPPAQRRVPDPPADRRDRLLLRIPGDHGPERPLSGGERRHHDRARRSDAGARGRGRGGRSGGLGAGGHRVAGAARRWAARLGGGGKGPTATNACPPKRHLQNPNYIIALLRLAQNASRSKFLSSEVS